MTVAGTLGAARSARRSWPRPARPPAARAGALPARDAGRFRWGWSLDSALGAACRGASAAPPATSRASGRCIGAAPGPSGREACAWLDNDGVNLAATGAGRPCSRAWPGAAGPADPAASRPAMATPPAPARAGPAAASARARAAGAAAASALVGSWQTVVVIEVPGDLQTWTTTWRFDAGGTCRQTVVTESLAEGLPPHHRARLHLDHQRRRGRHQLRGRRAPLTFDFSFAALVARPPRPRWLRVPAPRLTRPPGRRPRRRRRTRRQRRGRAARARRATA